MDLFAPEFDPTANLLPKDGVVHYYGPIMEREHGDRYFRLLMESIDWKKDLIHMFGKRIETKRKVAWYGDRDFEYTYSNHTKRALPWTEGLLALKAMVEKECGETFNSCLLNLYHNGQEGMAWHSDGEKELKRDGAIASLSLGAQRKFSFKHKVTKEKIDIRLEHGSLLVMKGTTQTHWLHRLPPVKNVNTPRVNLTFRTMNVPRSDRMQYPKK